MDLPQIAQSVPSLANLPASELAQLGAAAQTIKLRRHDVLFLEGDSPAGFYLVCNGWMKTYRAGSSGREILLDLMGPGEVLGPCCGALMMGPHACSAVALVPTTIMGVRGSAWKTLLGTSPLLRDAVTDWLLSSRRRCVELAATIALHDIESRLAALLLKLARYDNGTPDEPREVPPLLNHDELAAAIGTVREVVTRHVARLVDQGSLSRKGRRIIVQRPLELQAIAQRS